VSVGAAKEEVWSCATTGLTLRDWTGDDRSSLSQVLLSSRQTELAWRGDVGNSSHPHVFAYDFALPKSRAGQ